MMVFLFILVSFISAIVTSTSETISFIDNALECEDQAYDVLHLTVTEDTDDSFYPRDFSIRGSEPKAEDVIFKLYTRRNQDRPDFLDVESPMSLRVSHYNSSSRLLVIIHGYSPLNSHNDFAYTMKNELLKKDDINVVVMHWEPLCNGFYGPAVENVGFAGAQLSHLLVSLERTLRLDRSNVHLVGFSLGAHVAGEAGARTPRLGRITGLDPAGPMFMNRGPSGRLDRSDAVFVDVIHTDSGSLLAGHFGYVGNVGHADFYPNGGSRMRGCKGTFSTAVDVISGDDEDVAEAEACSHSRAREYFIESINSETALAYRCADYETFQKGKCAFAAVNVMGYHATPTLHGTFFCDTQSESPFLSRQVVVRGRVRLAGTLKTLPGRLTLVLKALNGPSLRRSSRRIHRFNERSSFSASFALPLDSDVRNAQVFVRLEKVRLPFTSLGDLEHTSLITTLVITDVHKNWTLYSCPVRLLHGSSVPVSTKEFPCP